MGDSVLLPQIRNLKNVADLRRKQSQLKHAVALGLKVDQDAANTFKLAAEQLKQDVMPISPNEEMLQESENDRVRQFNTALGHLKSIMPAVYAAQVLQQGFLGDHTGIDEFNRLWPGFQKYASNFGSMTPTYFQSYWQRYRKILEGTNTTSIYGDAGILDNIPNAPSAKLRSRPTVIEEEEADEPIPTASETEDWHPPLQYKDTRQSKIPPWYDNPLAQPTTESTMAKPQSGKIPRKYGRTYRESRTSEGAPTQLIKKTVAVKGAIASYFKPGVKSPPGVQKLADELVAAKDSPLTSYLDLDAEKMGLVSLTLATYALLNTNINPFELAAEFVGEAANVGWATIKQKGFQLILRLVGGPVAEQGYLAWLQTLQEQYGQQGPIVGGTVIRKGNAKIIGFGIAPDDAARYRQFGCYLVHMPSLEKNRLNIKFPSFASHPKIPPRIVSEEFTALMKKILEEGTMNAPLYAALHNSDKEYFDHLAHLCKVGGKLGITPPQKDNADIKRFELVRGQILAGNDAPQLIKELKLLTLKLVNEGKIPRRSAHDLLMEIAVLT